MGIPASVLITGTSPIWTRPTSFYPLRRPAFADHAPGRSAAADLEKAHENGCTWLCSPVTVEAYGSVKHPN